MVVPNAALDAYHDGEPHELTPKLIGVINASNVVGGFEALTLKKMTNRPGHPRFYQILEEMAELHAAKNADYGGDLDPLLNLREVEKVGIPAWKGVIVRLTDKMSRLQSYARKETFAVKDEGLKDTFKDMAIYAVLGMILFENTPVKRPIFPDPNIIAKMSEEE